MAFTRSLLIKALSGVAGVGGTTVGVLAGTGVFNKKEQDGNESVDSNKPGVGGEVGNKAGKGSTEQKGQVGKGTEEPGTGSHEGQTSDRPQQSDSDLPKDGSKGQGGKESTDAQEDGKDNTHQDSQPGVQTTQSGGGDEDRSGSTSEISAPGTSGNPVQGDVDPKPQSTNPLNSQPSGEEQKSPGVNEPQQSTPTIKESPNGTPAGQPSGDDGDSNLPNAGGTPRTEDAQDPGTGGDGAVGGRGSELPDSSTTNTVTQSQEDKINTKLGTLNIPDDCNFAKSDTSKTCQISEKELKKIKFENSDNEESTSDSETKNIQLKIEILTGNKKTAYGLNGESEEEGESDVTKDLLFTFSGFNNEINLDSSDGFILYPNTNPEFKVEDSELVKVWGKHSDLTGKVGINKKDNSSYEFESTTTLKYSLDGAEGSIKTLNSPNSSGTIRVEGDKENYNQGVKVEFSEKITGTNESSQPVTLEKGDYEIKYKDGDNEGWYLSKKNKVTEGKGSQGADGGGADTTDPNSVNSEQPDSSPSSNGLSSGQQLNNNQQDQVPTEDTNSHSKTDVSESDTSDTDDDDDDDDDEGEEIDTATDPKVKETNSKLRELNIPKKCRFTDSNKNKPLECSLTNKEFSEINFEDPEESDEEANDTFKAKLLIEILKDKKKTDYENDGKQEDLLFTLKDYTQIIKIEGDDDLLVNTNPEFKISESELTLFWDQTIYKLPQKLQLSLASGGTYNLEEEKTIKFSLGSDKGVQKLKATTKITEIASNGGVVVDGESKTTGAANYNQGFKYVVHQDVTGEEGNTLKAGNYEIKYDETEGWYLSLLEPKVTQPTGELTQ